MAHIESSAIQICKYHLQIQFLKWIPSMSVVEQLKKVLEESDDAKELNFSEIKIGDITAEIKQFFQQLENVEVIMLRNCGLTSLKNFPLLKKVEVIDVSENNLTDDSVSVLKDFTSLTQLFLNSNKIKNLDTIMQLKDMNLIEIDCSENPVSSLKDFSSKIFEAFQKIEIVNGFDKDGKEVKDEPEDESDEDDDEDDDEYGDSDEEEFQDDEEDYDSEGEEQDQKGKKRNKNK